MRASIVLLLVAACGGRSSDPPPSGERAAPTATATEAGAAPSAGPSAAPSVATPASLAAADGAPPVVLIIDPKGQRYLATAASWADLSAGKYASGPKLAGQVEVMELIAIGAKPGGDAAKDADETAGTGTAMIIEEGRMSRRSPPANDPIAGQRGRISRRSPSADAPAVPRRLARIAGEVTGARPDGVPAIVVAAPTAKASALVDAIAITSGMIAVAHGGQLRPLRIAFHARDGVPRVEPPSWLEARLGPAGVVVEAAPSPSTTVAWSALPAGALTGALSQARARRKLDAQAPVDVLVTPDLDVQRLIDALVALDAAGAKVIGLGVAPASGSDQAN